MHLVFKIIILTALIYLVGMNSFVYLKRQWKKRGTYNIYKEGMPWHHPGK